MVNIFFTALVASLAFLQGSYAEEELQGLIPHPTAAYHKFDFGTVECRTHSNGYKETVTHDQVLEKTKAGTGVPVLGLDLRNTLYKVNLGHDENGEEDMLAYFRILKSEKKEHAEKLVFLYVSTEYVSSLRW